MYISGNYQNINGSQNHNGDFMLIQNHRIEYNSQTNSEKQSRQNIAKREKVKFDEIAKIAKTVKITRELEKIYFWFPLFARFCISSFTEFLYSL